MKKQCLIIHLLFLFCLIIVFPAAADVLSVREYAVTATSSWETMPRLGNDGVSDLVVFTRADLQPDGTMGRGDIWYQRLFNGAPLGEAVQVTLGPQNNQLNDVNGDWIVYTAYDSLTSLSGRIVVCKISTSLLYAVGNALFIHEARVHGNKVVWREGGASATMVMLYDLAWIGSAHDPDIIAGPIPPTYTVDIGDRFVVWTEETDGQLDVWAYDPVSGSRIRVTDTLATNERNPSTSGPWIVWEAQDEGAASSRIIARNMDTAEERIIADGGVINREPSIDGDLITWSSMQAPNFDIFLHKLSLGESFQVTTDPADQHLSSVRDGTGSSNVMSVAYVDDRTATSDIYVSDLAFVSTDPCAVLGGDTDGDGVCDYVDNCPLVANADQADADNNGIGDACQQTAPIDDMRAVKAVITSLDPAVLRNTNMKKALINKLDVVIAKISAGLYAAALAQMQNDILVKTDGCAKSGAPDANDWIMDCVSQGQVYPIIIEAIQELQALL